MYTRVRTPLTTTPATSFLPRVTLRYLAKQASSPAQHTFLVRFVVGFDDTLFSFVPPSFPLFILLFPPLPGRVAAVLHCQIPEDRYPELLNCKQQSPTD